MDGLTNRRGGKLVGAHKQVKRSGETFLMNRAATREAATYFRNQQKLATTPLCCIQISNRSSADNRFKEKTWLGNQMQRS